MLVLKGHPAFGLPDMGAVVPENLEGADAQRLARCIDRPSTRGQGQQQEHGLPYVEARAADAISATAPRRQHPSLAQSSSRRIKRWEVAFEGGPEPGECCLWHLVYKIPRCRRD